MLTIGPSLFFYAIKYLRALQVATCNGNFLRICENVTKKLVMTSRVPLRRVVNCNAPAQQRCRAPRAAPARAITEPRYEIVQKVGPRSMVPPAKVSYGGTRVANTKRGFPFLWPLTRLLQHRIGIGIWDRWNGGQRSRQQQQCGQIAMGGRMRIAGCRRHKIAVFGDLSRCLYLEVHQLKRR